MKETAATRWIPQAGSMCLAVAQGREAQLQSPSTSSVPSLPTSAQSRCLAVLGGASAPWCGPLPPREHLVGRMSPPQEIPTLAHLLPQEELHLG